MQSKNYNVIGVMSGTSLDGVDLAHITFRFSDGKWQFELLECETVAYSDDWTLRLKSAVGFAENELASLDVSYTKLLAEIIKEFIQKNRVTNLDAVCSHGHTVLHQPHRGLTLQIGNLPEIAEMIGQTVVCDFRVADVNLGGQGAPLVPIGDKLLFSDYEYCLNLGGFCNVSFDQNGARVAFDISAVNTVMNFYANQMGRAYDNKGAIAQTGNLNDDLLAQLNRLDFYSQAFPKSLGFEYVKSTILPLMERFGIQQADKLRTFTEHVAIQIALALPEKTGKMLVTGGGAYNDFLIERMTFHLPQMQIVIPQPQLLEFKEALVFGLLGVLRLRNEVNVLASVTGAAHDHSSGNIWNVKIGLE